MCHTPPAAVRPLEREGLIMAGSIPYAIGGWKPIKNSLLHRHPYQDKIGTGVMEWVLTPSAKKGGTTLDCALSFQWPHSNLKVWYHGQDKQALRPFVLVVLPSSIGPVLISVPALGPTFHKCTPHNGIALEYSAYGLVKSVIRITYTPACYLCNSLWLQVGIPKIIRN